MNTSFVRQAVVAATLLALAGCSTAQKKSAPTSTVTTSPFMSSSKKLQQDLSQTETDFGQLESQAKLSK